MLHHGKWQSLKTVTWPQPSPFRGWYVILLVTLDTAYLCKKFDDCNFSYSWDMIGALKFKLDNVTLPCPFQGRFVICRLTLAMFNPHTKFEVSMITCYEDMKGNGKWRNCGALGSFKVIGNVAIRYSTYDFLIDFIRNYRYASIFYRFWVTASYFLTYPTYIWHRHWGWPCLSFTKIFGTRKLESLGYRVALFVWSYV